MVSFFILYLVSFEEICNGVKLCRFILDGGILVLRCVFDGFYFFLRLVVVFNVEC